MSAETICIAGRYNKYLRNLSQSPWVDKDDVRIKHSVQELIEDGLNEYIKFDKSIFSSSGREDVDVRMLGRGRPFAFKLVNVKEPQTIDQQIVSTIQAKINSKYGSMMRVRDLQIVAREDLSKNLNDGQESKRKEYRALCCCTRTLTTDEMSRLSNIVDLTIDQKTPIRVLHRRTLTNRRRKIHSIKIESAKPGEFDYSNKDNLDNLFVITLSTEAGTYIKEFVHGDFGRTEPNLSSLLGDCDTDLIELDVLQIDLDWPPQLDDKIDNDTRSQIILSCPKMNELESSETNLSACYKAALKFMQDATSLPRGDKRQDLYLQSRTKFEQALSIVEDLELFSTNESIEDLSTANIKYLLIPAYLAKIHLSAECGPDRARTFSIAHNYLQKFLQLISCYGLGSAAIEAALKSDEVQPFSPMMNSSLESAMKSRTEKIERFKRLKLLEEKLEVLENKIKSGQEVDDEVDREYHLNLLNKWIEESHETLEREVKPALYFERNRSSSSDNPSATTSMPANRATKQQTVTIVKNDIQKKVFGLGYPSHPTVTIEEFIAQKKREQQSHQHDHSMPPELTPEDEERLMERDDPQELARKRAWDEFKDDTKRGSGNTLNRG